MAKRLHDKCMRFALESDDDAYRELSHRAVTIAYIKAMVLYMAQGCQWSEEIERFAEWSLDYDLWCKCHFFGNEIRAAQSLENVSRSGGRPSIFGLLNRKFMEEDVRDLRREHGMPEECRAQLRKWIQRGMVTYDPESRVYTKVSG